RSGPARQVLRADSRHATGEEQPQGCPPGELALLEGCPWNLRRSFRASSTCDGPQPSGVLCVSSYASLRHVCPLVIWGKCTAVSPSPHKRSLPTCCPLPASKSPGDTGQKEEPSRSSSRLKSSSQMSHPL